jgi:3'-phosphoadenosine 5'-phosphosulfate sulfotransferase (PAPS reductase)/FAD synthetase
MNYFEFCEGLDDGSIEKTENNFILLDRLKKIRETITKYGEENFYVSFSGGKDSTVLSALIDMALPDNKIPRVYANTGIEYRMILDFVEREREAA